MHGEPCPGLLSEDEPSQGPRSVGGRQGVYSEQGSGQLGGASQKLPRAPSPWGLVKVQMLAARASGGARVGPRVPAVPSSIPPRPGEGSALDSGDPLWVGGLVRIGWGRAQGQRGAATPRSAGDAVGERAPRLHAGWLSLPRGSLQSCSYFCVALFSPASDPRGPAHLRRQWLWILHLQPMHSLSLFLPVMSTQPPPTPTQPGGGVLPEAGGSGLRPAPPWPLCPLSSWLLRRPSPPPPPTPSPVVPCSGFVPSGLGPDSPFGWDAQNQIWCLFF